MTAVSAKLVGTVAGIADTSGYLFINKVILVGEILTIWHFCVFAFYIVKNKTR